MIPTRQLMKYNEVLMDGWMHSWKVCMMRDKEGSKVVGESIRWDVPNGKKLVMKHGKRGKEIWKLDRRAVNELACLQETQNQ
mmetsp:Transcript_3341/g.5476  ORF Transcript_3341/g.5476 Transcript_3341/m.5476 type:complete len:82 (-) Transcript_3341:1952-2197(-)